MGLAGKRILVTRTEEQAKPLIVSLQHLGAVPVLLPLICIMPPDDEFEACARALEYLAKQGTKNIWCIFTSANGIHTTMKHVKTSGFSPALFASCSLAVVGSASAKALETYGLQSRYIPGYSNSTTLGEELIAHYREDISKALVFRAQAGHEGIVQILQNADMDVEDIPVYRTAFAEPHEKYDLPVRKMLQKKELDSAIFASRIVVESWVHWLACNFPRRKKLQDSIPSIAYGASAESALLDHGIIPACTVGECTVENLVHTLLDYYEE